ncbi:GPI transamidase component PIG-T [Oryza brachyantha]|uniref:GPI transamidase component PIG-T n=1 Tax=Oryza brachyantha TaxID=4533 RepID=UPI001ADC4E33|nr:GPI transamidase component PIG-T [Oryza brachyantha]
MAAPPSRPPALRRLLFLSLLLLLLLASLVRAAVAAEEGEDEEEVFTEELLLRPLPDRKTLAHFHFRSSAPPSAAAGRHHHVFPKAIAQLVQQFHISELELSFTQGRWNYERWGGYDPMSTNYAKPPGVELWAAFDLPLGEIDATWKNLTHTLSGLFCASINFLESSTAFSAPRWGFKLNEGNLRYGALPREAVCTENLTPWLKLLPCRDKAGIASLLYRPSIYKGYYHSQKLKLTSSQSSGIIIDQTLTVVLQPDTLRGKQLHSTDGQEAQLQPSWSIKDLFNRKLSGKCLISKSSRVFVEIEKDIVDKSDKSGAEASWTNELFVLSTAPNRVFKELKDMDTQPSSLYVYDVSNYNNDKPLDVGITWKLPLIWYCTPAPYHANRFLMGSGNERGSIALSFRSTNLRKQVYGSSNDCSIKAVVFQVVPWYVKVYYHSLQIFIDGNSKAISEVVDKIHVTPSVDKLLPGSLEMLLRLPCSMQSATLSLDFDKGFLHIDEYPPDANQGFDIPSALVTFPEFNSSRSYPETDTLFMSPLLQTFKEDGVIKSYTEVLLVPLTTPDFSMPYNVITFTCTVLALYFGSLLNALRRRIGEEEMELKKAAAKRGLIPLLIAKLRGKKLDPPQQGSSPTSLVSTKLLLKVVFVAVVAVAFHYLSNS